jgi:HEAT repeat protein
MLRSDDPDSNEWAAMGLGDLRSSEAVPVLIDKLASDKADVLFSVISALGEIRDPRAIGPLKDLQARTRAGIFELRDLAATIRDIERVNSM